MGWIQDLSGKSLKQIISDLIIEHDGRKLLKHCFKGNPLYSGVLWSVWEYQCENEVKVIIHCDILQYWKNGEDKGWAVKSIDETCGPYYHTCPLSYLKLASGSSSFENVGYSKDWRQRVIDYHANKKSKKLISV